MKMSVTKKIMGIALAALAIAVIASAAPIPGMNVPNVVKNTTNARDSIFGPQAETQYLVTVNDGVIYNTGNNYGYYKAGVLVSVTANTGRYPGQVFEYWTASGINLANPYSPTVTFTMPANNVTLTANFASPTYTLWVTGGSGSGQYMAGETVTAKANTPPTGQAFVNWTASGINLANPNNTTVTFTMPANNVTLTANFADTTKPPYTLTVTGGSGSGQYQAGRSVTVTANPPPTGQAFAGWTSTGIILANPNNQTVTFTMPANNVTLTAVYAANTYTISVIGGTIAGTGGASGGQYTLGTQITITANPPPNGQVFSHWSGSPYKTFADSTSETTTFTVSISSATIRAIYKDIYYQLTVIGGTIVGVGACGGLTGANDTCGGLYTAGTKITVKANDPPYGKQFVDWTSNHVLFYTDGPILTFYMPNKDETLTAIFVPVPYTVTINGGTMSMGGVNKPSGSEFHAGDVITVTANTPDYGYAFTYWTTLNPSVIFANPNSAATTFIMPAGNVMVTANFTDTTPPPPNYYTVTVINGSGGGQFEAGQTVIITADAQYGYKFVNWTTTSNGVTFVKPDSAVTAFTMPDNNVAVTANYAPYYTVTVTNGTGSGQFLAGQTVNITANTPPDGYEFVNWTTTSNGVTFVKPDSAVTAFTMPANDVAVTAYFEPSSWRWYTANTSADTFYISTADELAAFAQIVNGMAAWIAHSQFYGKTIILRNDINLSAYGAGYRDGKGWEPIGSSSHVSFHFQGIFDGNGKTISGLYINDVNAGNIGLFGYVQNATIKNLGVVDVNIRGRGGVGGVVGYAVGGSVINCYSTGTVNGSENSDGGYVGGVVGGAQANSIVAGCYSTSTVSGYQFTGGVVGLIVSGGSVNNCYSTGTVSGIYSVGGVVGFVNSVTVTSCYSTGSISGSNYVGGVVGDISYNSLSELTISYCAALNSSVSSPPLL